MIEDKYIQDIKEIKGIMLRSSRFVSVSGLSGIIVGIIALCGAFFANKHVFSNLQSIGLGRIENLSEIQNNLLIIALSTSVIAIASVILLTYRELKKNNEQVWNHNISRIITSLSIPIISGGILCMILLLEGYVGILAPLTLIFYGLALVNVGNFTLKEIYWLGLSEIVLGLIAACCINYALIIWAIGFGILHIICGIIILVRNK